LPPVSVQETKSTTDGQPSLTPTSEAALGPLLVTVIVYVTVSPGCPVVGETVLVMLKSAVGGGAS
jgi:hypothetical protein